MQVFKHKGGLDANEILDVQKLAELYSPSLSVTIGSSGNVNPHSHTTRVSCCLQRSLNWHIRVQISNVSSLLKVILEHENKLEGSVVLF